MRWARSLNGHKVYKVNNLHRRAMPAAHCVRCRKGTASQFLGPWNNPGRNSTCLHAESSGRDLQGRGVRPGGSRSYVDRHVYRG